MKHNYMVGRGKVKGTILAERDVEADQRGWVVLEK
jgi:hypothetical protein